MKKRQDFYHEQYNQYINWTDSWKLPMFKYIPIGQRYYNSENLISPVSINKQGMRCIELDQVLDNSFKSADISKVLLTSRCTPPIPPVAKNLIPKDEAIPAIPDKFPRF